MSNKTEIFTSVVETNKGILYKVANTYCYDVEDRKDLIQEIIVQLWKSFDNYNNEYKYSTWIYRIALNVAISFYRKEKSRRVVANPLPEGVVELIDNNYSNEKESDLNILKKAISELKELDKALTLLYLEEKSYKEIAQIIGISETNVSTKVARVKNVLKQKFIQLKNNYHG